MKRNRLLMTGCIVGLFCASIGVQPRAEEPVPLPQAHSHNDYTRERPLFDALDLGFCSVEADIFLVDGALLVAHDLKDCEPEKTLQSMYLDPLLERVRAKQGRVYPDGPDLTLLIDIKSEGESTYAALREVLKSYAEMLTVFTDDSTETRAVTVIISGNVPHQMIYDESPRLAAADGRPHDLGSAVNRHRMPMISARWSSVFRWTGRGEMPEAEQVRLRDLVKETHANGQRLRFWGLPQRPTVYPVLYEAGVDFLNADDLPELRDFLMEQRNKP